MSDREHKKIIDEYSNTWTTFCNIEKTKNSNHWLEKLVGLKRKYDG